MPKVIVLTQFVNIGGLERLVFSLSVELRRRGEWEPVVCYYDDLDGLPNLKSQLSLSGVQTLEFQKKKGASIALVKALSQWAKENQIEVIHTHDLGPLVYAVAVRVLSLFRIRIVHTQHSFVYSKSSRKYQIYERVFAMFANRIGCVSSEIQERYLKLGINRKRLVHIPNGVVFSEKPLLKQGDRFKIREELLAPLALERGHSEVLGTRWILCLARVHVGKGQNYVLRVWNSLPERVRKECSLFFVGPETSPGLVAALKDEAARLPDSERIYFSGASLEPQKWIQAADLFISGSESEGMPLAALEAIGSGLPGLLSDIRGHQMFVEIGSPFVKLFSLDGPRDGAAWIESQIDEMRRDEGGYSQRTWQEALPLRSRYGISKMAEKYTQLYQPAVLTR